MTKVLQVVLLIPFTCFGQGNETKPDSVTASYETFLVVEQTAQFPGGMGKFYEYVGKNLKYPKQAKKDGIQGKVYVEFVINQDGSIDRNSVRALQSNEMTTTLGTTNLNFDPHCQEEAVRLMKECPKWKPALIKNNPVRQKMVVPIAFKL